MPEAGVGVGVVLLALVVGVEVGVVLLALVVGVLAIVVAVGAEPALAASLLPQAESSISAPTKTMSR